MRNILQQDQQEAAVNIKLQSTAVASGQQRRQKKCPC